MHHNETKTPLIRLAKRGVMEPWKAWCIRVGSILVALLLGGLVMSIALPEGSNIFSAYGTIIELSLIHISHSGSAASDRPRPSSASRAPCRGTARHSPSARPACPRRNIRG